MDPNDLYSVRQQFILGGYRAIADLPLPDQEAEDRLTILLYHVRSLIALDEPSEALKILPASETSAAARAGRALTNYVKDPANKETYLEELRDLSVEMEAQGEEGGDEDEYEKHLVQVLAGTAFAREGEVEEALETLGAGTNHRNLEATALIAHLYLSIARPDLAKKEFDRAHKSSWATDDLLLQHIEASIGLVTGKDSYSNPYSFYNEQLQNPSLSSANGQLLTARGMTSLLKGEYQSAASDFEEAVKLTGKVEALVGSMVAASFSTKKSKTDANALWERIQKEYPEYPLVADVASKSEAFDLAAKAFNVPPPIAA